MIMMMKLSVTCLKRLLISLTTLRNWEGKCWYIVLKEKAAAQP